jgi:phenylalanyl-tRNA synthetase beta chain
VRVFELGRVFGPGPAGPAEESRVAVLLAGAGSPDWSAEGDPRPADFFDGKGVVELLGRRLGAGTLGFAAEGAPGFLHPGKSAVVSLDGRPRGYVGVLHPDVAAAWGLRDDAVVAEMELDALTAAPPPPVRFRPLPRAPAVARDLSVVVDENVIAAEVVARVRQAAGDLLKDVSIVKRYAKPPIPPGKASLTLGLVYQDPGRTLTGEEVQASLDRIVAALRSAGLEIRGE